MAGVAAVALPVLVKGSIACGRSAGIRGSVRKGVQDSGGGGRFEIGGGGFRFTPGMVVSWSLPALR